MCSGHLWCPETITIQATIKLVLFFLIRISWSPSRISSSVTVGNFGATINNLSFFLTLQLSLTFTSSSALQHQKDSSISFYTGYSGTCARLNHCNSLLAGCTLERCSTSGPECSFMTRLQPSQVLQHHPSAPFLYWLDDGPASSYLKSHSALSDPPSPLD